MRTIAVCSQFGNSRATLASMQLHGLFRLQEFCGKHPPARSWVKSWVAEAKGATWVSSHDVKQRYPTASFLAGNLVIFNVKGNDYRMATQIAYQMKIVVVKWIGTHDAYSKVNWESAQNEANGR